MSVTDLDRKGFYIYDRAELEKANSSTSFLTWIIKNELDKGEIMLLIIALVIASLFVYFLKDKLKQYPNIFYIGAAVVTIVIFSLRTVAMPQFVRQNIVGIFAKGTIGTAFFIIVMITGALPRGSKLIVDRSCGFAGNCLLWRQFWCFRTT